VAESLATAASARRLAARLAGVPIRYSTIASGSRPYSSSVKKAPSTVPWEEVASAKVINNTTKAQPMATMYIS